MSEAGGYRRGYRPTRDGHAIGAGGQVAGVPWTVDALSAKGRPATAGEWAAFAANRSLPIVSPNALWLCQAGSGDLVDVIGGSVLTANGSPGYGATIPGWASRAVTFDGATPSQRFANFTFADAATVSILVLMYAAFLGAPAAGSLISTFGTNNNCSITSGASSSARRWRYRQSGNIVESANDYPEPTVVPVFLRRNVAAGTATLFAAAEILAATYDAAAGDDFGIGAVGGGTPAPVAILYLAVWLAAAAQLDNATVTGIRTGLGW